MIHDLRLSAACQPSWFHLVMQERHHDVWHVCALCRAGREAVKAPKLDHLKITDGLLVREGAKLQQLQEDAAAAGCGQELLMPRYLGMVTLDGIPEAHGLPVHVLRME